MYGCLVQPASAEEETLESHSRHLSARSRFLVVCCTATAAFCLPLSGRAQYVARRFRSKVAAPQSSSSSQAQGVDRIPSRFLGWNYTQRAGAAYFRRFGRHRHGLAIPVQNTSSGSTLTSTSRTATFATSLTSPATLPGFLFRPTLPAGFIPTSVATGDFNSDGRLDWVVATGGDNNLWLYLGNGDGTSQLPTIIPLAGSPVKVVAADLRGNGTLDLVVVEPDSNTVGVLLGDGHGGFSAEARLPVPAPPLSLAVQDFNGDGHLDIVVGMEGTQQTGALAYLQGNGDGTFGSPVTSAGPPLSANYTLVEMAAADLNGDKLPDVVANDIGVIGAPGVWVYLNQGDGTFSQPQVVGVPSGPPERFPINLALGDLNRDGCADLVVLDTWDLADRFLGHCDGTFQDISTYEAYGIGEIGYGIALADVNGDGRLDIVSSGFVAGISAAYGWQSGHLVSVLPGDGQGGFSPPTLYRGEPGMFSLAVADLKGDGFPDIITANQDTDSASVYANDGQGEFGQPQGGYVGYYVNGISTGVINAPLLAVPMAAKDVNGDGKQDLSLIEGTSPGDICGDCDNLGVLLNQGNGIFARVIHSDLAGTTSYNISDLALNRFRNTGLPDLVTVGGQFSMGTGLLLFAPNNGNGTFGPATSSTPPGAGGLIGVGDFNGDGKLDFVAVQAVLGPAANTLSPELTVFLGDGVGGFTPGYQAGFDINSGMYPTCVYVGDFNGDGKLDVLVQVGSELEGTLGHDVYEFLGNGDGTFALPKIVLTDAGPIAVGDLNHDGRPDIIEQVEPLTTLPFGLPAQNVIYLCQTDGSFTLGNTYEPYSGKVNGANVDLGGPILADFNGDGNLDIAVYQSPTAIGYGYEPYNYFQILAGNGDGTFTPTYTVFDITTLSSPQFAADVSGDGRADLIELDGATSSYHVIPAVPGPAMQVRLVSDPVVGSNGNVQINLALASSNSTTINLSTSDPAITIPSSVTIPAGSVSLDVPFQIDSTFNPTHVFSIQAQLGTEVETAYGTQVTQAAGFALNFVNNSFTIAGGQTTPDYGLLVLSLDGYSTTVQLQCMGLPVGATCLFGQTPLPVPSGSIAQTALMVATTSGVMAGSYTFTVMVTDGTVSRYISAIVDVVQGSAIQISPTSLTFPLQTVGTTSAPQTVTVTNSGGAAMILSIGLFGPSGPSNPNFAQTNNCGGSLGAGQSCTISVTFTPTVTGSVTGSVTIDASTVSATRQFVNLSGTAEGALVQLSASSLNFNTELYVGQTSAPQTVTVWNTGTIPINFSSITITGANATDFALATGTSCSTSAQLGVGFGCAINVTFTPSGPGTWTGTLAIADDVSGSPQTVSLSGIASPPDFTIGPTPGSPSSATVTAGGSATYSVALTPLGAFDQTVTLNCPGAPSGGTCSLSPTSVALSSSGAQNVTVTVTTKARSLAMPRGPAPPTVPPMVWWFALMALVALNLLAGWVGRQASLGTAWPFGVLARVAQAVPSRALALGSILLAVVLLASCGGGGGSAPPSSSPGTPAGTYALSVTGTSGNLSHTTIITLTVK
jgi:FG-GAP-like repeat/Cep192 domain 4